MKLWETYLSHQQNWTGQEFVKQAEVVYKGTWTQSPLIYTAPSILSHYRDVL